MKYDALTERSGRYLYSKLIMIMPAKAVQMPMTALVLSFSRNRTTAIREERIGEQHGGKENRNTEPLDQPDVLAEEKLTADQRNKNAQHQKDFHQHIDAFSDGDQPAYHKNRRGNTAERGDEKGFSVRTQFSQISACRHDHKTDQDTQEHADAVGKHGVTQMLGVTACLFSAVTLDAPARREMAKNT